jgi:dinuclear metal center YbgI/SA1388 family protein
MITVATIAAHLDKFAPLDLAASWDNVGLLLGDRAKRVKKVMTCLTVTPEVAAEAVSDKVQLIVTHHPILFRGAKRLTADSPEGRIVLTLARAGVAVYCPHTAFDNTKGGINDSIARKLGLVDVTPLRGREGPGQSKVVVFVPDKDLAVVSDAMFEAGAGRIGQYSQCSFRLAGTGTFFGSDAANPSVGQKGRREEVSEWRLETVCPDAVLDRVLRAIRKTHSYEEPAFDVVPLRQPPSSRGEGRVGQLPKTSTLREIAQKIKSQLSAPIVQIVGDPAQKIEKVVIVCGAGGEMLSDAIRAKADLFLTGEMRFHDYLAAQAQGIALCLPGHYATERFGVDELAERLQAEFAQVQVWASRSERDPVGWVS